MNQTAGNFDPEILKAKEKKGKQNAKQIAGLQLEILNHMGLRDVVQQLRA